MDSSRCWRPEDAMGKDKSFDERRCMWGKFIAKCAVREVSRARNRLWM